MFCHSKIRRPIIPINPVGIIRIRLRAACALAVVLLCPHVDAFPPQLPDDENGLYRLLEERDIDSAQYEQLLAFYALPVSVPQGELAYLARAFPEIEDLLPTPKQLEGYSPFDNRQIRRLLGDFPVLADLEPILRFNAAAPEHPSNGEMIFGINKSPIDKPRGQRVRFRYKSAAVSTDGSVALSDSGALWQNRKIGLSYKNISVNIGNFRQPIPDELMLGHLSQLNEDDKSSIKSNWLYSSGSTWNGLSLEVKKIPGAPMLGVTAFGHVRPGERGGGGGVSIDIAKKWRAFAGVTAFELGRRDGAYDKDNVNGDDNNTDDPDNILDDDDLSNDPNNQNYTDKTLVKTITAAHLYGEYKDKTWRVVTELGLPLDGGETIPALSLRVSYKIKNSSAEYHLINYPSNFDAPMSRVKRQTLTEIGIRDTSLTPSVQKHSLKTVVPIIDMIRFSPEIDFTSSEGEVKRVYGKTELRLRNDRSDISLKHSSKIFTTAPDSMLHTTGVRINLQAALPLALRTSYQRAYGYYNDARNTYAIEFICTAIPNAVIAPYASGRYVTEHTYRLGVKTELHLYKKTWTSITLEIPAGAGVKGDDNVFIKGSSSYAF